MITFHCAHCGHRVKVKDEYAGKKGRCPSCREILAIPEESEDARSDTASAAEPLPALGASDEPPEQPPQHDPIDALKAATAARPVEPDEQPSSVQWAETPEGQAEEAIPGTPTQPLDAVAVTAPAPGEAAQAPKPRSAAPAPVYTGVKVLAVAFYAVGTLLVVAGVAMLAILLLGGAAVSAEMTGLLAGVAWLIPAIASGLGVALPGLFCLGAGAALSLLRHIARHTHDES